MISLSTFSLEESDQRLIRRFARHRDNSAFSIIMCRYADMVYTTSRRILGDEAQAADVSQETFFELAKKADGITGSLGSWLHKVAGITFGSVQATNSIALPSGTNGALPKRATVLTNAASAGSPVLKGMTVPTNLLQQVQQQFLSDAGPEANAKFNELLGGLLTGKLSVGDIRAQAKTAADQLRALQRESGEEGGDAMGV
jgi:hypothetical protein